MSDGYRLRIEVIGPDDQVGFSAEAELVAETKIEALGATRRSFRDTSVISYMLEDAIHLERVRG